MHLAWTIGQESRKAIFWLFCKDLNHQIIPDSSWIFGLTMSTLPAEPLLPAKEAGKINTISLIFKAI
jgi:hypothetical protein